MQHAFSPGIHQAKDENEKENEHFYEREHSQFPEHHGPREHENDFHVEQHKYQGKDKVADVILNLGDSLVAGFISVLVLAFVYAERKISAHMQNRMGPMRVGWHGILQTLADGLKLIQKEDIMPAAADKWIWWWAPGIAFVSVFGGLCGDSVWR